MTRRSSDPPPHFVNRTWAFFFQTVVSPLPNHPFVSVSPLFCLSCFPFLSPPLLTSQPDSFWKRAFGSCLWPCQTLSSSLSLSLLICDCFTSRPPFAVVLHVFTLTCGEVQEVVCVCVCGFAGVLVFLFSYCFQVHCCSPFQLSQETLRCPVFHFRKTVTPKEPKGSWALAVFWIILAKRMSRRCGFEVVWIVSLQVLTWLRWDSRGEHAHKDGWGTVLNLVAFASRY